MADMPEPDHTWPFCRVRPVLTAGSGRAASAANARHLGVTTSSRQIRSSRHCAIARLTRPPRVDTKPNTFRRQAGRRGEPSAWDEVRRVSSAMRVTVDAAENALVCRTGAPIVGTAGCACSVGPVGRPVETAGRFSTFALCSRHEVRRDDCRASIVGSSIRARVALPRGRYWSHKSG